MNQDPFRNNPAEVAVHTALMNTKRRSKLVSLGAAAGVGLAGTLLYLLLFVIADHRWTGGVPGGLRIAALATYAAGVAVWLVIAGLLPLLRRISDLYAARLIERSHPEFYNSLIGALQIAEHTELPGSVRMAVERRAAQDVDQVDPARAVSTRRFRQVAGVTGALFALLLIYGIVSPKPLWPSLWRAFGSSRAAPTKTLVTDMTPPDGTSVLRGTPVPFGVQLGGILPESAYLRFSRDDGLTWLESQQLELSRPLNPGNANRWQALKPGPDVQHAMVWQVIAGDARVFQPFAKHLAHQPVKPD